ncbi:MULTISPECIES: RMD1 family protein [Thiomicrorhabdus]|uniref:RMD1 family protein n=1 Tax=Thiomicrorhabdus heinhorstiae TaxID=2748010 RepID=A0ABS0BW03_9GAMM|nr:MULTISPECIES: RMD1 family protein [Thiomicrorhabdus]MBF6057564.1 RMD1 family protein [Thiomicrorhabdus heinhorstiae]
MANLNLISISLPEDFTYQQLAERIKTPLKKGIEATYYAEYDDHGEQRWLFFTQFDVLTFINWPREQILATLQILGLKASEPFEQHYLHQDWALACDPELQEGFTVDNQQITLSDLSLWPLMIVALVISQSVGLEKFETEVDRFYAKGRYMLEHSGRLSWMKRHEFSSYAKELSLLHHDMVLDLMLLDKPNALWDNESYEKLYNTLAKSLELQERFEIVSYKLNSLKDDMTMMLDLYQHKHSSFLEWIIILLIFIEILMGLADSFSSH